MDDSLSKVNYWYHEAAKDNNEVALYELGKIYELDEIDGLGIVKNIIKAFEFYKKSGDKGYTEAQYKLGHFYYKGIGTDIDKEKALELYMLAAEKGNIDAQNRLTFLYEHGELNE